MATRAVESVEWVCDRSDCGESHIVEEGKLPPGFSGKATHVDKGEDADHDEDGGAAWYACRATHIRGAIEGVTGTGKNTSDGDPDDQTDPAPDGGQDGSGDGQDGGAAPVAGPALETALSGAQSGERPA